MPPAIMDDDDIELTISTQGCSAAPFFRTVQVESCVTGISFLDQLQLEPEGPKGLIPGTVLELYGQSGSGKTEITLNAVVSWILPHEYGGLGGTAVFVDLDYRLNVGRLRDLLLHKIQQGRRHQQPSLNDENHPPPSHYHQYHHPRPSTPTSSSSFPAATIEALVDSCLNQVILLRCADELEAFSVLEILKTDLNHSRPTLLILDSLGCLLYEKKIAESCKQGQSCLDFMMARCIARMISSRSVSVIATKPALLNVKKVMHEEGPSLEHRDYLPPQWSKLVTHRLTLVKEMRPTAAYDGENQYEQQMIRPSFSARLFASSVLYGMSTKHVWFSIEHDGIHCLSS